MGHSPSRDVEVQNQPVEIASLLGWTQARPASGKNKSDGVQMNRTAEACNSAYTLVKDGHVESGRPPRRDMSAMPVKS